jgi:hypothetical protein
MTPDGIDDQASGAREPSQDSGGSSGSTLIVGIIAMLIGSVFLLVGFVLWVGEKADRLVIFPWAGRLTMLVGIAGLAIGAAFAGRRAAVTLIVLMVIGGIALFAIGLAFVVQLGTRLYHAGGLLTSLVGLIVLDSVYGMDGASEPIAPSRADNGRRD